MVKINKVRMRKRMFKYGRSAHVSIALLLCTMVIVLFSATVFAVPRTATLVVAANDASALCKIVADYVCDGTDDQLEINSAIGALPSGGGKVVLNEGTYNLDHRSDATYSVINLKDNVWLQGSGPNTILKLANNAVQSGNDGHPIIDTITSQQGATFAHNVKISDLQIDGNKANQVANTNVMMNVGIWIRQVTTAAGNKGCVIENVIVHDTISAGIYLEEIAANRLNRQSTIVNNVVLHNCGASPVSAYVGAIHLDSVSGCQLTNIVAYSNPTGLSLVSGSCYNVVRNFETRGSISYGTYVEGTDTYPCFGNDVEVTSISDPYGLFIAGELAYPATSCYDNTFRGVIRNATYQGVWGRYIRRCYFDVNVVSAGDAGVLLRDCENCEINVRSYACLSGVSMHTNANHNVIRGEVIQNQNDGVDIAGDYNLIEVYAKDNSQVTNNSYREIRIDGNYSLVKGSVCRSTLANKAAYSIAEYSGDNNVIVGNMVSGAVTAAISTVGANTKVYHNKGYVTEKSGTATVAASTTSVVVSHGLVGTPTRVLLTPTIDTVGKRFWVSSKTTTTFTITVDSAPVSSITFDWRAVVGEE